MFFQSFIQHHQVNFLFFEYFSVSRILFDLVLYFDHIKIWENIIITLAVGVIIGLCVMIFVKPRLKEGIEGEKKRLFLFKKTFDICFYF